MADEPAKAVDADLFDLRGGGGGELRPGRRRRSAVAGGERVGEEIGHRQAIRLAEK